MFANRFSPSVRPSVRPPCPPVSVPVRPRPCPSGSASASASVSASLRPRLTHVCTGHVYLSAENGTELPTTTNGGRNRNTSLCVSAVVLHGEWVISVARRGSFIFEGPRRGPHCFGRRFRLALLCETCLRVFLKPFSAAFSPFMGFQWCL